MENPRKPLRKDDRLKKSQAVDMGELFERIATVAPVGISVVDHGGNGLFVNVCWCAMTGFSPELAAGQGWREGIHPEDRKRMLSVQKVIGKTGEKWQGEYRLRNAKGEEVWVYGQITGLRDRNGNILGCLWATTEINIYKQDSELLRQSEEKIRDSQKNFLGRRVSNRDITTRKKALEELRASDQRFRLALDASSDGVWDRDLVTNEVYYGENWHRVLGYSDEEAKSKDFSWKNLLHPEDREKTFAAIQEHFEGRSPRYEAEFRMRNSRGQWQWFLSRGKVVTWDEHGRPLRFAGTHTDITKSKNYEIELQQTRDNLEEKVRERTAELEEANVALKVLLKKREKDKVEFQRSVLKNLASLIDPYLTKLGNSPLNEGQQLLVNILKTNLNELTSSFSTSFAARWIQFTPAEIQIANLIKSGKLTKDIAAMLNISPGTINIHRKNIRKKLGLTNQKANLQTVLSSFSQEG